MTIKLSNLILYGYHGMYAEEKVVGGEFEVNIAVSYEENIIISSIEQTINYSNIFEILQKHFAVKYDLLETLAQKIAEEIHNAFNQAQAINISIEKLNAPILNFTGRVGVDYHKNFSE